MGKKSDKPLEKILISFFQGDVDLLKEFYSEHGYNLAVRTIVHNHCNKLRERASRAGVNRNVRLEADSSELFGASGGGADAGDGLDQRTLRARSDDLGLGGDGPHGAVLSEEEG